MCASRIRSTEKTRSADPLMRLAELKSLVSQGSHSYWLGWPVSKDISPHFAFEIPWLSI
jgi:hypothetical protein